MAAEVWDMDVFISTTSADDFPTTGSADTMYIVQTTVGGLTQYSFNYWNGNSYSSFSVGPKPHPHA